MKSDFELSFKMTEEEKERIKRILLENGGVRHYLLKLTDGTELDVVEYKEYQNLEIENQKLKEKIKQIIEYADGTDMLISEYEQLCKIAEVE